MKGFIHHKGKGEQVLLPSRAAANQLAKGEQWQRSVNNYAKVTPSGENALNTPDVLEMAQIKY